MRPVPAFSPKSAAFLLAVVTALGLILRLYGIGWDLWIDEVASLEAIRGQTVLDLLRSYTSANQHTLNSILMLASIRVLGESEWSVRITAVLFGVATIPVTYWIARLAHFERGQSLVAALLLALSYHHIWFSQNARGYSGYVLFSLVATGALVSLLRAARPRWIALFAIASALNFLALLPSVCVFAAQVIAAGGALWMERRRGAVDRARVRGVALALGAAAVAAAVIFAPLARTILGELDRTAPRQVTAYKLFSLSFVREILAGALPNVPAAFLVAAAIAAAIGVAGVLLLIHRAPVIGGVLVGAHFIFAGAIFVLGWPVYPRLFILCLPLAILALVALVDTAPLLLPARWVRARALAGPRVLTPLLVLTFALLLPGLYRYPKQAYRAALDTAVKILGNGGLVVAVGTSDRGIEYYHRREPDHWPLDVRSARTVDAFDQALGSTPRQRVVLITTFNAAFRAERPELWNVLQRNWQRAATLPGTLRGGELSLWVWKATATAAPGRIPL